MTGVESRINRELIVSEAQSLATLDSGFRDYQQDERNRAWIEKLGQIGKQVNSLQLSDGKLNDLLSDFDNRVALYVLTGLALNAQRMGESDTKIILTTAMTHPARAVREAARIYLFNTRFLSPTPSVAQA